LTVADGRRGGSPTKGGIEESVDQAKQMIEAWFESLDYSKYDKAYREIALSGTAGALDALALQQDGGSSDSGDTVDYPRFLSDAYARTIAHAWDGTRDLTMQYLDDVFRYVGWYKDGPPPPPAGSGAAKKAAKRPAKRVAKKAVKKRPAKKAAKKAVKKRPAKKTVKKAVAKKRRR
jgi:hypothetical protein